LCEATLAHHRITPLPNPPPQGGREQTEIAAMSGNHGNLCRSFPRKRESSPSFQSQVWVPAFAGTNGGNYFAETSGNFLTTRRPHLLTTYRVCAREAKSPLVEGVSGNDPKAERGRGEKSPRWSAERRARQARFARRAPRLTHAAHSRLHRRDNDTRCALRRSAHPSVRGE